jgi:hypothetical protein
VALPGPAGVPWALGLLVWAASAAVLGEAVRRGLARWVRVWRRAEPVERLLLDFYLGGATMYLVAAVPGGAFVPAVVLGLPLVAAAGLVLGVVWPNRHRLGDGLRGYVNAGKRPGPVVALLCAAVLLVYELAIALPVGTGNTYDSSLLTLYVSLLLQHHSVPLSFQPYASVGLLYPQGTTVWLGWAQLLLGPPAARTSLLVTPLFLAIAPLGAYVLGRRIFGTEAAGIAFALTLTAVGSWTRVLVAGSNDFVFAFPLVLLLAAQSTAWTVGRPPTWVEALGFGTMVGYSAALNPTGAEWLLPTVLLVGLVSARSTLRSVADWIARWAVVAAASLIALVPTLFVLAQGWNSPGFTPGAGAAPAGARLGITFAQFVGDVDPYLFRPTDVSLSPIPILRAELAILLTVGVLILLVVPGRSGIGRYVGRFRSFVTVGGAVLFLWLVAQWFTSAGGGLAERISVVSSPAELSISLFTLYTLVAAVPLVLCFERLLDVPPAATGPVRTSVPPRAPLRTGFPRGALSVFFALVIVVPGAVLTGSSLPPVLERLYDDLGNVTGDDFALLEYAGSHLPSGARVLIAPGSAAAFLPGYAPDLVLLYPILPGFPWGNSSYREVVSQLTNATLNRSGLDAMGALDVQYVVVTGANTILWPPFSPAPLLAAPNQFPLLWQQGDDYLFERTAS